MWRRLAVCGACALEIDDAIDVRADLLIDTPRVCVRCGADTPGSALLPLGADGRPLDEPPARRTARRIVGAAFGVAQLVAEASEVLPPDAVDALALASRLLDQAAARSLDAASGLTRGGDRVRAPRPGRRR